MDLEPIFLQVEAGDPVGAAYRLVQLLGDKATGRFLYEAGSKALARRDELGEGALRFARILFGEAVEREPDLAEAQHDLASTMRELGMAQDAIAHYRRALEIAPGDVDSLIGLGAAQCDAGQLDSGIATLKRATEEHAENGHAFANLGVALEAAGRDEEAAGAYAKAVARFEVKLTESEDDEEATDAAMRLRWARIQHAELLERLQRWPQAVVEFRHLYEEECAVAEANGEAGEDEDSEPVSVSVSVSGPVAADSDSESASESDSESDSDSVSELEPDDDEDDEEIDELEAAGRLGLERLFARLVQLGRIDLAYLVLDDLGGELADERTRATYAIYDPGDGLPQIMVEHWDGQAREKLDPTKKS